MTMPWRNRFSEPWSVSCWTGIPSALQSRRARRCSATSRGGTIRAGVTRPSATCHPRTSRRNTGRGQGVILSELGFSLIVKVHWLGRVLIRCRAAEASDTHGRKGVESRETQPQYLPVHGIGVGPHVLPKGFVRIRHYGFLANAGRVRLLSRCRLALGQPQETAVLCDPDPGTGLGLLPLPHQLRLCPNCGHGSLRCVEALARPPPLPYRWHHVAA